MPTVSRTKAALAAAHPPPMTAKAKKPSPKKPAAPAAAPVVAKTDYGNLPIGDQVRAQFAFILACFAMGHTMGDIGAELTPPLVATQLRIAIANDTEMSKRWAECRDHRAHHFVELAAGQLQVTGLLGMSAKEKAEVAMKLAEKTAPLLYGAKSTLALTGGDGGPVATTITMSPSEAYQAMLKGT